MAMSTERLLLTLWVGSLWAIGYIAVPMAFSMLGDITLAGNYAGKLFSVVNMLGLGCGTVLIISKFISKGMQVVTMWRFWTLILMTLLTIVFCCYLQPEIAAIKQLTLQGDAELERFTLLHTVSKNIFMLLSLLGLALVVSSDNMSVKA